MAPKEALEEHPGLAIDFLATYESSEGAKARLLSTCGAREAWAAGRERLRLLELHRPAQLAEALHLQAQRVACAPADELLWLAGKAWNAGAERGAGQGTAEIGVFLAGDELGGHLLRQAKCIIWVWNHGRQLRCCGRPWWLLKSSSVGAGLCA